MDGCSQQAKSKFWAKKPKKRRIFEPIALKKAPRESLVWSGQGKMGWRQTAIPKDHNALCAPSQ